jgi:helicase MOV-10
VVRAQQTYHGHGEDRLQITFEHLQLRSKFVITRSLRIVVGNEADHKALQPKAPYVPRKRTARQPESTVVPGVMAPTLNAIPYKGTLTKAPIPKELAKILSAPSFKEILEQIKLVRIPKEFNSDTYARHFKNLIWIEEHRMEYAFSYRHLLPG